MNNMTVSQLMSSRPSPTVDSYTDLNALQNINLEEKDDALKKVAKQFESLFFNMMLKSMRAANATFEKDSMFSGGDSEFYRDMYDKQLSLNITEKSGGTGLADVLYRQLQQQYGDQEKAIVSAQDFALPIRNTSLDRTPIKQAALTFSSPEDFVRMLSPHAKKAAEQLGLQPDWLLAQAALETGWGSSMVSNPNGENSNNLFNIKADSRWQGEAMATQTHEYREGVLNKEQASFRRYDSVEESFSDYVSFLKENSRYQDALNHTDNGQVFIEKLQQAGYATDPRYSEKIKSVYRQVVAMQTPPASLK